MRLSTSSRCYFLLAAFLLEIGQTGVVGAFVARHPQHHGAPSSLSFVSSKQQHQRQLSANNNNSGSKDRPELANQAMFLESIRILKQELARQQGIAYTADDNDKNPNKASLIGRLVVPLPLQPPPGLDLTEAGSMVLVSGLSQETADATGMMPLDTIVSVSVPAVVAGDEEEEDDKEDTPAPPPIYYQKTLAVTLEDMAQALGEASAHAIQNNRTEIELELNRIMVGYYK